MKKENDRAALEKALPYERLYKLAQKMHCWIFLHSFDEQAVYDELELTDEENFLLGYGGCFEIEAPCEGGKPTGE